MRHSFYQRTDWLSFWITSGVVLSVYLFTLAPEVTLEWSGIYATGAMYGGISPPPGFPLWNFYGWLFIHILPFSNIAWRLAVSSAVAGALACGMVALLVSRGSALVLETMKGFRRLPAKEERWLRLVAGFAAGAGFGFNGAFWGEALIVDIVALDLAVFLLVLCFLLRWVYEPEQSRYLYAAFLLYGLNISVSLSMVAAAPGLPFIVLFHKPALGRDLFFTMAAATGAVLLEHGLRFNPVALETVIHYEDLSAVFIPVGIGAALISMGASIATRRLLTEKKIIFICGVMLLLGLSIYLILPIVSMTNPPCNWAYPRTSEGFVHLISRGQFEHWNPTRELDRYVQQIGLYWEQVNNDVGFIYLLPGLLPFYFLRKMGRPERGWMMGLTATFLCLSLFMVAMLNPSPDRQTMGLTQLYLIPSYLILMLWAGYGLVLLGTLVARKEEVPGGHLYSVANSLDQIS